MPNCPLPIHPTISTRQLLQLSSKQLGDKLQPFSHGPYQPLQPHHLLLDPLSLKTPAASAQYLAIQALLYLATSQCPSLANTTSNAAA